MQVVGNLKKMLSKHGLPIEYWLPLNDTNVYLNELLGKKIGLTFLDTINCTNCGKTTRTSFNQGFCYKCFITLASCDTCILKPERCHYHLGTCRETSWGELNCMVEHYVYLANTSSLKVGITRTTQVPTRWIDQGASFALPIMLVKSRLHSGLVEVALAEHLADKTNWRNMLQNKIEAIDLVQSRSDIFNATEYTLKDLQAKYKDASFTYLYSDHVMEFNYPVLAYPTKITTASFDKQKEVVGVLYGIKGQYLLLDTGVINIRKHAGYLVELKIY